MARGARKSLQEKIAQKEELIEALTTRLKKEKEELNELVQQQKMEELDELRAAVETRHYPVCAGTNELIQCLSARYEH